jgi:glutathione S-transferase
MRIYGDTISGNCLKVRWLCDRLALPYEWIETSALDGTTRGAQFLALNPAGQVPAIELDDGRVLGQSGAIMRYLARGSPLIPADPFEAVKMDEWLFWEQNNHEPNVAVCIADLCYRGKTVAELDPRRVANGKAALALMDQHLATRRFFVAQTLTLADIALVAYSRRAPDGNFDLAAHGHLRRWIADVERSLKI